MCCEDVCHGQTQFIAKIHSPYTKKKQVVCPKNYHISEHTGWLANKIRGERGKGRDKFSAENVDVVVNADETFLLFHPFGEKVIAPTGMKRVGSAVQVDNEKFGATVLIACEYRTSSILPPMIIFTGVYCAKLMTEWASYHKGNCLNCWLLIAIL